MNICLVDDKNNYDPFQEYFAKLGRIPWYKRLLPWHRNKELRTFTIQLWDCSTYSQPIGTPHFLDVLINMHRKHWWEPKYIGFTLWM